MNPHLWQAIQIYEKLGVDFQKLLSWHICHGVVVCNPRVFALCFHSHSDELPHACEFHHSDTLFVTFAAGDMRCGLQPFVNDYRHIAFKREFKNSPRIRLHDMKAFFSKLKQ